MWKVLDNVDKRCIPLRGMETARGTNMEGENEVSKSVFMG
jgi:hypothetical protein